MDQQGISRGQCDIKMREQLGRLVLQLALPFGLRGAALCRAQAEVLLPCMGINPLESVAKRQRDPNADAIVLKQHRRRRRGDVFSNKSRQLLDDQNLIVAGPKILKRIQHLCWALRHVDGLNNSVAICVGDSAAFSWVNRYYLFHLRTPNQDRR